MTQSVGGSHASPIAQPANPESESILSGLTANCVGEVIGNFAGKAVSVICGQGGYLLGAGLSYWAAPKLCYMAAGYLINPSIPLLRTVTGLYLLKNYGAPIVSSISYACAISSAFVGDRVLAKPVATACTSLINRINPFASSETSAPDQTRLLTQNSPAIRQQSPEQIHAASASGVTLAITDRLSESDETVTGFAKRHLGEKFNKHLETVDSSIGSNIKQQLAELGNRRVSSLNAAQQQHLVGFLRRLQGGNLTEEQRNQLLQQLVVAMHNSPEAFR